MSPTFPLAVSTVPVDGAVPYEVVLDVLSRLCDGVVGVDINSKIVYVDRGAEIITGYTAAGILGSPLAVLLPAEVKTIHEHWVRHFLQAPVVRTMDGQQRGRPFPLITSAGAEVWCRIELIPSPENDVAFACLTLHSDRSLEEKVAEKAIHSEDVKDGEDCSKFTRLVSYVHKHKLTSVMTLCMVYVTLLIADSIGALKVIRKFFLG